MIEVNVESIRVSLINQSRLVVLRERGSARYLSIWIGAFEADAITVGLQEGDAARPLTHDLICKTIEQLGAKILRVEVNDLRDETFFADIILSTDAGESKLDARPSDAIALAVRRSIPIYVSEEVMQKAGQMPAPEHDTLIGAEPAAVDAGGGGKLDVFRDFVESLDLSDLDGEEDA